jgi:WD40 repeat protein
MAGGRAGSWADGFEAKTPYSVGAAKTPEVFAEGVISTEDDEINGSFSADGMEYYFSKVAQFTTFPRLAVLCVSRYVDGKWSTPQVLPFSGKYVDLLPRLSPDGKTMYFSSSRPAPGLSAHVLRIWAVERNAAGWSEPHALAAPINAPDTDWNWAASVTRDGTMYFASSRGGTGAQHIFRSRLVNGVYTEPEKLGSAINSQFNEADPFISADEHVLIFSSLGTGLPQAQDRPETLQGGGALYARGDLYVSTNENGTWTPARHLEHAVNTTADESSPSITPDGQYLFFTSERSPFTVPTSHPLIYGEIEKQLHETLNGHGNIFFISCGVLGLTAPKASQ